MKALQITALLITIATGIMLIYKNTSLAKMTKKDEPCDCKDATTDTSTDTTNP